MTLFVIDRFEGDLAVGEDETGRPCTLARSVLPPQVQEGMVLRLVGGTWQHDANTETQRRNQNFSLQQSLFE